MSTIRQFSLYDVTVDINQRLDEYRAREPGITSIHPAVLKDAGDPIKAVAKVTATTSVKALTRLRECAEIHKRVSEHSNVLQVYGVKHIKTSENEYFVLIMEEAEGSLRDVVNPSLNPFFIASLLLTTKTRKLNQFPFPPFLFFCRS